MKKVLRNFIAFTLIVSAISANAQPIRYLDNVFTNVTVTSDVQLQRILVFFLQYYQVE